MQIAQCGAHIADGVQHVGADDEVERPRFEFLLDAGFFEIENLELHFRKTPPASARRRRKMRPRHR